MSDGKQQVSHCPGWRIAIGAELVRRKVGFSAPLAAILSTDPGLTAWGAWMPKPLFRRKLTGIYLRRIFGSINCPKDILPNAASKRRHIDGSCDIALGYATPKRFACCSSEHQEVFSRAFIWGSSRNGFYAFGTRGPTRLRLRVPPPRRRAGGSVNRELPTGRRPPLHPRKPRAARRVGPALSDPAGTSAAGLR
jgi:hypothetical protein